MDVRPGCLFQHACSSRTWRAWLKFLTRCPQGYSAQTSSLGWLLVPERTEALKGRYLPVYELCTVFFPGGMFMFSQERSKIPHETNNFQGKPNREIPTSCPTKACAKFQAGICKLDRPLWKRVECFFEVTASKERSNWVLRQTRWVLHQTWWVRFDTQKRTKGRKELAELSRQNSVRARKLTELRIRNCSFRKLSPQQHMITKQLHENVCTLWRPMGAGYSRHSGKRPL